MAATAVACFACVLLASAPSILLSAVQAEERVGMAVRFALGGERECSCSCIEQLIRTQQPREMHEPGQQVCPLH